MYDDTCDLFLLNLSYFIYIISIHPGEIFRSRQIIGEMEMDMMDIFRSRYQELQRTSRGHITQEDE